uniref:Sodium channel modifier 1 zinc-finger domain-containing protein n=1 Tax=Ciona savignyi TaxID=51511 RepID=H2Z8J7_CIOSA
GNDTGLLRSLKRKRVNELLGPDIPLDEASFTCDGRLTCLVCHGRPILDNIDILIIHRKGKKHLKHLDTFKRRKHEDLALLDKRIIEAEDKGENCSYLKKKKDEMLCSSTLHQQTLHKTGNHKLQPKLKLQLIPSTDPESTNKLKVKTQIPGMRQLKQPSSQHRASCLEKVAKTKSLQHVEKRDFSKLSQEEK